MRDRVKMERESHWARDRIWRESHLAREIVNMERVIGRDTELTWRVRETLVVRLIVNMERETLGQCLCGHSLCVPACVRTDILYSEAKVKVSIPQSTLFQVKVWNTNLLKIVDLQTNKVLHPDRA